MDKASHRPLPIQSSQAWRSLQHHLMQKHNLKCRLIDGKVSVCTEAGTNTPLNVVMAQMKCESTYSPASSSGGPLRSTSSAPHDYNHMQPRSPPFDTTSPHMGNTNSYNNNNGGNYNNSKQAPRRTLSLPMGHTMLPISSPSLDLSAISPEMLWPTAAAGSGDDHAAWTDMLIGTPATNHAPRH